MVNVEIHAVASAVMATFSKMPPDCWKNREPHRIGCWEDRDGKEGYNSLNIVTRPPLPFEALATPPSCLGVSPGCLKGVSGVSIGQERGEVRAEGAVQEQAPSTACSPMAQDVPAVATDFANPTWVILTILILAEINGSDVGKYHPQKICVGSCSQKEMV